jgi:hypothetical protein
MPVEGAATSTAPVIRVFGSCSPASDAHSTFGARSAAATCAWTPEAPREDKGDKQEQINGLHMCKLLRFEVDYRTT